MAKIYTAYNPTKIIAADTNVNELEFGVAMDFAGSPSASAGKTYDGRSPFVPSPSGESDGRVTLLIKVLTGTFLFAVGKDPTANPGSFTVGDSFTVTVHNRVMNLFFKATTNGDTFSVSI